MPSATRKPGRPSTYNETLGNKICELRASGLSIRKISEKPGMPHPYTIMRWRAKFPEFGARYEEAWKQAIEEEVDNLIELADDASKENYKVVGMRIDTRKWIASKVLPSRYGDRVEHDVTGRIVLITEAVSKTSEAGTIADRNED